MTRLTRPSRPGGRRRAALTFVIVLVLIGAAIVGINLLEASLGDAGPTRVPSSPAESASGPAASSQSASATAARTPPLASPTPAPSAATARTAPASDLAAQRSSSPPAPSPAPSPAAAPASAVGFKVRATVVPMGFPLGPDSRYRYGQGWRVPRAGVAHAYNQIRGLTSNGAFLRAHDGLDLQVPVGTPVLAPFDGVVVDPRPLWTPWDAKRYGTVVVIRSTEPTSTGYLVILAHLSRRSVVPGDSVRRGLVVGRTGTTGNAAGTASHLHIEVRAPFLIRYGYAGVIRQLDVFDIEPSLRAADPNTP